MLPQKMTKMLGIFVALSVLYKYLLHILRFEKFLTMLDWLILNTD